MSLAINKRIHEIRTTLDRERNAPIEKHMPLIEELRGLYRQLHGVNADQLLWIEDDINWLVENRLSQARVRDYCASQPAGSPVFLDGTDISVCLAPGYGSPIPKRPRRKLKPEERAKLRQQRKEQDERYERNGFFYGPKTRKRLMREAKAAGLPEDYFLIGMRRYIDKDGYREKRRWYSEKLGCYITIREHVKTKMCKALVIPRGDETAHVADTKGELYFNTWTAAQAYNLEAEQRAMELLKSKVTEEQFKRYFCTGFLMEISKKSRLVYIFRRCRPILVYRQSKKKDYDNLQWYAALCIHTQGYYGFSWAGTMTPTDEVVAQLLLMRGDEKMLWRRANKHKKGSACADV
jgi:hypothetical protein